MHRSIYCYAFKRNCMQFSKKRIQQSSWDFQSLALCDQNDVSLFALFAGAYSVCICTIHLLVDAANTGKHTRTRLVWFFVIWTVRNVCSIDA